MTSTYVCHTRKNWKGNIFATILGQYKKLGRPLKYQQDAANLWRVIIFIFRNRYGIFYPQLL